MARRLVTSLTTSRDSNTSGKLGGHWTCYWGCVSTAVDWCLLCCTQTGHARHRDGNTP